MRRTAEDLADIAGIGCLVVAGWEWSSILGLALAGLGLIAVSAVVGK
jgi:hypothetical protein